MTFIGARSTSARSSRTPLCRRRPARRGTSLFEMAVVLAIAAFMVGIALPRYARSLVRYRATAAANRVAADLALARVSARTTASNQSVSFGTPAAGYTLSNLKDPDRPASAYAVDLTRTPYEITGLSAAFTPLAGGSAVAVVNFDRYGIPDAAGTVTVQVGDVQKTIVLDGTTGRATVK